MMKLIFATSNKHKLAEIKAIGAEGLEILSLTDIGFEGDIPETQPTIEGNSLQKAQFIAERYNLPCFSEDTGLIIDGIDGEPGVYSARYAGEHATFDDNVNKVLAKMEGKENRAARFKTVITYYDSNRYVQFEGITEGEILNERVGTDGFGYDPIFKPKYAQKTYAEMSMEEKNSYSHRKKSFDQLANHLKQIAV
jgi:XTP/dITP diphosphohydrolase